MKKCVCIALVAILLIAAVGVLPIHGEEGIYENVIRLHVLANSDSKEDQALKLKVRDAVLDYTAPLLADVHDKEEAAKRLQDALPELERVCAAKIRALGYSADVSVQLGVECYPRRTYESVALPAGEYLSLRVSIGQAKGQNWWCVLFPPLCLSAATADTKATCLSAGLTEEQYRLITDTGETKYKLRFKILEVAEGLFT